MAAAELTTGSWSLERRPADLDRLGREGSAHSRAPCARSARADGGEPAGDLPRRRPLPVPRRPGAIRRGSHRLHRGDEAFSYGREAPARAAAGRARQAFFGFFFLNTHAISTPSR